MYDDLVKRLRDISNSDNNIKSNYIGLTMLQAADAIEELSKQIEAVQCVNIGDLDCDSNQLCTCMGIVRKWLEEMDAKKPRWIPITSRPMTEDECREYVERTGFDLADDEAVIYTCPLPDNDQKVLVSFAFYNDVGIDIFVNDGDYGFYFEGNGDMDGIEAWMPLPEPYKGEKQ